MGCSRKHFGLEVLSSRTASSSTEVPTVLISAVVVSKGVSEVNVLALADVLDGTLRYHSSVLYKVCQWSRRLRHCRRSGESLLSKGNIRSEDFQAKLRLLVSRRDVL